MHTNVLGCVNVCVCVKVTVELVHTRVTCTEGCDSKNHTANTHNTKQQTNTTSAETHTTTANTHAAFWGHHRRTTSSAHTPSTMREEKQPLRSREFGPKAPSRHRGNKKAATQARDI
jgi:hypothetical protein